MATRLVARFDTGRDGPCEGHLWTALSATDTVGQRLFVGHRPGKSVHLFGTFGGAVTIRGSNKQNPVAETAADWIILADPQGNPLSFTTPAIEEVLEAVLWLSPLAAAGVVSVDIAVCLVSARSR